jgi:thioredoxin reductase (NADPH)
MPTSKPILLTVDDDPEVLRAVERDLRRRYGATFRILRADSGQTALDALHQLKARNEDVALVLSDQRMPGMDGAELLRRTREIYPDAKRALLTAYADTEAAIRAINNARIDYYLTKPWEPPEEQLYPVVQDLLDDWQFTHKPAFDGVRIIGNRWSPSTHQVKNFLARNHVPYRMLDVEGDDEARTLLAERQLDASKLPIAILPDGAVLTQPTNHDIAGKIGLKTQAMQPFYDLIIVGGGPAGLAAGVYGASEGLRTLMIEREAPGGQAGQSSRIENYLGFPVGLSGSDLARRATAQATRFGAEILTAQEAVGLRSDGPYRIVRLADGSEVSSHAVIVATGVSYRKLDAPGIEQLTGAGVYYGAAMTEAMACRDQHVFIVGGANSAGQAAMYFAQYARMVTMLVRGEGLAASMSQYLIDQIGATPNIEVLSHMVVAEAHGQGNLQRLTIKNVHTGEMQTFDASALFIFIGAAPHTEWIADTILRDEHGFVLSGRDLLKDGKWPKSWPLERDPYLLETCLPGVFVAGDVRHGSVKRVASSVGEGAMAVSFVHQYLAGL